MFVVNRTKGERFRIVGRDLRVDVEVLSVKDDQVRLGICLQAEVAARPMADELLRPNVAADGRAGSGGRPSRTRRPRRVWPPVEIADMGRY